jgi:DNA-binding transcriptional regulator YhcF (GntR family)
MERMTKSEPLYKRIEHDLRLRLGSGEYAVGDKLPGIAELQAEYGVAGVQTIRNAYEPLIAVGIVEARQGAGYFLTARPGVPRQMGVERASVATAEQLLAMVRDAESELQHLRLAAVPEIGSIWNWGGSHPSPTRLRVEEVGWNGEKYMVKIAEVDHPTVTNFVELGFWIEHTTVALESSDS